MWLLQAQQAGKDSRGHVAHHIWLTETAVKPRNLLQEPGGQRMEGQLPVMPGVETGSLQA